MLFTPALKYLTLFVQGKNTKLRLYPNHNFKYEVYTYSALLLWLNIVSTTLVPMFVYARAYGPLSVNTRYNIILSIAIYAIVVVIYGHFKGFFKKLKAESDALTDEEHEAKKKKQAIKCIWIYCAPFIIACTLCVLIQKLNLV